MKPDLYRWILTLALWGAGSLAIAAIENDNPELRIVGLAMHQETSRDIYLGALHIGKLQSMPENFSKAAGPRVMDYRIIARRTSVRSLLGNILLQGELATGQSADSEIQLLASDIMSAVQGSLYAGDSFEIALTRDGRTVAFLNGFELAQSDSRMAADYFLQGWIGERGPSTSFRLNMLSGEIDATLMANYHENSASEQRLVEIGEWSAPEVDEQTTEEPVVTMVAASVTAVLINLENMPTDTDTTMPALPKPDENTAVLTAQAPSEVSTDEPVQVALAAAAPVLAPEQPNPIASLDAMEYSQRLMQFNHMLLKRVYANIRYPRAAVRRNLQGALELDITVSQQGQLINVAVVNSSGHNSLDNSAIKAAMQALSEPLNEIDPVAMAEYGDDNAQLVIPVPINFVLTE
jgi:protein TonB